MSTQSPNDSSGPDSPNPPSGNPIARDMVGRDVVGRDVVGRDVVGTHAIDDAPRAMGAVVPIHAEPTRNQRRLQTKAAQTDAFPGLQRSQGTQQQANEKHNGARHNGLQHHQQADDSLGFSEKGLSEKIGFNVPTDARRLEKQVLLDRYEVVRSCGEGGMGTVYQGFDRELRRPVALKILHSGLMMGKHAFETHSPPGANQESSFVDQANPLRESLAQNTEAVARELARAQIHREAQAIAAFAHPNVVEVYAVHLDYDPPFLVMEWLSGGSLHERTYRPEARPLIESLRVLAVVAETIDAMHGRGIAHGDIKPSNILFGEGGRMKIIDFGLSPFRCLPAPSSTKAQTATVHTGAAVDVAGTPSYMSPELLRGEQPADHHAAARADRYAFAVTAFEALTKHLPFPKRNEPAILRGDRPTVFPASAFLPHVPRAFDEVLSANLDARIDRRDTSCATVVARLQRAIRGLTPQGTPYRILVADDDRDCLEATEEIVRALLPAASISTCASGKELDTLLAAQVPHLCIVDFEMPYFSPIRAVMHAAEVLARAPRWIFITGVGSGNHWRALQEVGVDRFFVKPVLPQVLDQAIQEVLLDEVVLE